MINSIKIINTTSIAMYMWIKTKYTSYQYENDSALLSRLHLTLCDLWTTLSLPGSFCP